MAKPLDKSNAPTLKGTLAAPAQPTNPVSIEQLPPELMSIAVQGGLTPEDIGVGQTMYGGLGYGMGQSMDPLTQLAVQARQAETAAQQQYQQAQTTPAAQTSPYADLLKGVMGNLSSVLQGSREPFKQAMEGIKSERAALETQRVETLKRLSQVVDERSKAAREAGNAEAEEKSLQQKDRIEKTLEAMLKSKADREEAARRASERQGATPEEKQKLQNSAINSLVDNWRQDQNLKSYREMYNALGKAYQQVKGKDTVSDIALINSFAKANDERTGVRTEEFRIYETAAGWIADKLNLPKELMGKGKLPEEVRRRIIREMENLVAVQRVNYETSYRAAFAQGRAYGLPDNTISTVLSTIGAPVQVEGFVGPTSSPTPPTAPPKKPGATKEQLAGLKTKPPKPAADTTRTR